MITIEKLSYLIRDFFSQDSCNSSFVYSQARVIRYIDGGIDCRPLQEVIDDRKVIDAHIVRIDMISHDLAYAQVEYYDENGAHSEVIGMIRIDEKWIITCILSAYNEYRFANLYKNDFKKQTEDLSEISQLLLRYCHDVYIMDAIDCLDMFWPQARMYHPNNDGKTFTDVEIQILNQRWRNMPDPKKLGISEFSRIFHIEMLDADIAIAKIGCAKLKDYFNDYLYIIKVANEWKIVNKMTKMLYSGDL